MGCSGAGDLCPHSGHNLALLVSLSMGRTCEKLAGKLGSLGWLRTDSVCTTAGMSMLDALAQTPALGLNCCLETGLATADSGSLCTDRGCSGSHR